MKRTFSYLKKNALWGFILTGFLFLLSANTANAQSNAGGVDNPEVAIAQRFNITAYNLGTFSHDEALAVLKGLASDIKPLLEHNPSEALRLKYRYLSEVISDVQVYSIATEISLLKKLDSLSRIIQLSGQNSSTTNNNAPLTQFASLYNEIVNELL